MQLRIEMLSETTFGRGEGTAGLVDTEIDHDPDTGLPFIHARTLKGLLVEACADIFYTLEAINPKNTQTLLKPAALFLFGVPGSTLETDGKMKIGHAKFSDPFRQAVADAVVGKNNSLTANLVLDAWTQVRTQTAASVLSVPDEGSLRSVRVLRRGTTLHAPLTFVDEPDNTALALLDAVARTTQRAGLSRNRGRGRLAVRLLDDDHIVNHTEIFEQLIGGEAV